MGGAVSPGLKGAIGRFGKFVAELRPKVAKALTPLLNEHQQKNLAAGLNPYGKPQPPLAASTLVRKKNTPGAGKMLARTFQLWNESYFLFTGNRIIQNIPEHGQYAEEGDSGRGKRPPRKILWSFGVPAAVKGLLAQATDAVTKAAKI